MTGTCRSVPARTGLAVVRVSSTRAGVRGWNRPDTPTGPLCAPWLDGPVLWKVTATLPPAAGARVKVFSGSVKDLPAASGASYQSW